MSKALETHRRADVLEHQPRRTFLFGVGSLGAAVLRPRALLAQRMPTFLEAHSNSIPAPVEWIETSGYELPGDGGDGRYRATSQAPIYPGCSFQDQGGRHWEYVPDYRGVNALAFGAKDDGAVTPSRAFTGTDNARPLQRAIDFAVYAKRTIVYLPARNTGCYRISRTLQLGYGKDLRGVALEGDGPKRRGHVDMEGTCLLADFAGGPVLAVNGARLASIRQLGVMGANFGWIESHDLMGRAPRLDDKQVGNWLDPALGRKANGRYTPYAAIAIDPYAGPQPSEHYPDVHFPSWLGSSHQYGKEPSSHVSVEDCWIGGFVAMCAVQPSGIDANGDFIKFTRVVAEKLVYVLSAGNSQGRAMSVADCSFAGFHSGVVNGVHGAQTGQLDLTSVNSDWESCYQLLDIVRAGNSGPFHFLGGYSESAFRIGNWGQDERGTNPLIFDSYSFNFSAQNPQRGWASSIMSASETAHIAFRACTFRGCRVAVFQGDPSGYSFEDCVVNLDAPSGEYEKRAMSLLAGGVMLSPSADETRPERFVVNVVQNSNADTGRAEGRRINEPLRSDRAHPVCAWSRVARSSRQQSPIQNCPALWHAEAAGSLSACTLSGLTLRMVLTPRDEWVFARFGPLPGDVIYHDASGSVFFVSSRQGLNIVAKLQNNYASKPTGPDLLTPLDPRVGTFFFGNARVYLPEYLLRGDIAKDSPEISNVSRYDGEAAWIEYDSQVAPGDYLLGDGLLDQFVPQMATQVVAVSAAKRSISLAEPAVRTLIAQPLGFFVRPPPSNA